MNAREATERETPLPHHIAETVNAVQELHLRHRDQASRFERATEKAARVLGQPVCLIILTVLILVWTVFTLRDPGLSADWLEAPLNVFAVYATLLILAGQRRQERLATVRDQLTLQLALLNENKSAKIIALLEEFRRDNPVMKNRHDPEAAAMAAKIDTTQVSEAIARIDEA